MNTPSINTLFSHCHSAFHGIQPPPWFLSPLGSAVRPTLWLGSPPLLQALSHFWPAKLGTAHLLSTFQSFVEIFHHLSASLCCALGGLCIFIKKSFLYSFTKFSGGSRENASSVGPFSLRATSYTLKNDLRVKTWGDEKGM